MNHQPQNNQEDTKLGLKEVFKYLAEILTISGGVIYGSGFVIVNAYLSQKGISNVRLLHAAFIPPGILFFLLLVWAVCLSSLSYFLFRKSLIGTSNWGISYKPQKSNLKIKKNIGAKIIQESRKVFNLYNTIIVIRHLVSVIFAILILGAGTLLISYTLSLAFPIIIFSSLDLAIIILPVMLLFAVFTAVVGYNYLKWNDILEKRSYIIPTFSVLVIIFVQLYSLYHIAGQIYGKLPPSVGGGAPEEVVIFVAEEDKPYFDALGVNLCEIDVETTDNEKTSYGSNILWWFWQFNDERRFGTSGDAPTAILYLTLDIENGPIFAIQGEKVQAVKFWPDVEYDRCE